MALMEGIQRPEADLSQHVAVQHQQGPLRRFREQRDGPRCPEFRRLMQEMNVGGAGTPFRKGSKLLRKVVHGEPDSCDTGSFEIDKDVLQDRLACNRQQRLRHLLRDRPQALAKTAHHDNSLGDAEGVLRRQQYVGNAPRIIDQRQEGKILQQFGMIVWPVCVSDRRREEHAALYGIVECNALQYAAPNVAVGNGTEQSPVTIDHERDLMQSIIEPFQNHADADVRTREIVFEAVEIFHVMKPNLACRPGSCPCASRKFPVW